MLEQETGTAQKMNFSIKDFFSKCNQIWKTSFFVQCDGGIIWPQLTVLKSIHLLLQIIGFIQIISGPTHILLNSSCFELIFTNQANVVIESGVHPNCHHQLFL